MFQVKIVRSNCQKEIEKGEEFLAKLRNPYQDGMVRIKKFIEQEVDVMCMDCYKESVGG